MFIITGIFLMDMLAVVAALMTIVYFYFQWTYRMWKRRNIHFLEPKFPRGNLYFHGKRESRGEDIYNIVEAAIQKGRYYRFSINLFF